MRLWKPFAQRNKNWFPVQPESVSCQYKAVYLEHYFAFFPRVLGLKKSSHKGYLHALYSLCGCRARIKPPANSSGCLYPLQKFLAFDPLLLPLMRCSFCNCFCFGVGFHTDSQCGSSQGLCFHACISSTSFFLGNMQGLCPTSLLHGDRAGDALPWPRAGKKLTLH